MPEVKLDPHFPVVVVVFEEPTVKLVLDYDAAMQLATTLIEHCVTLKDRK